MEDKVLEKKIKPKVKKDKKVHNKNDNFPIRVNGKLMTEPFKFEYSV